MPSRAKKVDRDVANLPSIPRELVDVFLTGPMTGEAINAAGVAFKKALIEASLACCPDRVDRGTPGSIPIRVWMEHRFQQWLQVSANNLLPNTISDRRNTQRPRPARRLRYVHPAHGWRHIAARRQSIPELVKVVAEAILKALN
jgi:hypothetical protein